MGVLFENFLRGFSNIILLPWQRRWSY